MTTLSYTVIILSVIAVTKAGIKKCCPENEVVIRKKDHNGNKYNTCFKDKIVGFQDVKIYSQIGEEMRETGKKLMDLNVGVVENFAALPYTHIPANANLKTYLTENGTIYLKIKNTIQNLGSNFCVDHDRIGNATRSKTNYWILEEMVKDDFISVGKEYAIISAMLVTAFFLGLVLVVFGILPRLRTVGGIIQIFFCASLMMSFILMAAFKMLTMSHYTIFMCKAFTYSIYFFLLANFFWMNVMSFDIWRCFSQLDQRARMEVRVKRSKLIMYSLYAWALPLMMTIAMAAVNEVDPQIDWFITPEIPAKACFLTGQARLFYLHVPMLILISLNWVLFLLTTRIVIKLKRGTSMLRQTHNNRQYGFMDYVKLSLIMGLSWVLEVVGVLDQAGTYWYITDTYNMLVGVFFFLCFVCNRNIWQLLRKKFSRTPPGHSWKTDGSTRTTEPSDSLLNGKSVRQDPI